MRNFNYYAPLGLWERMRAVHLAGCHPALVILPLWGLGYAGVYWFKDKLMNKHIHLADILSGLSEDETHLIK